jgi:hypothetical protein
MRRLWTQTPLRPKGSSLTRCSFIWTKSHSERCDQCSAEISNVAALRIIGCDKRRTESLLTISKLVSSCQSSNHTRSSRLLCFRAIARHQFFWKGIRTLLVFATICDRSSHVYDERDIIVKNVHAMRLSCSAATRRLIATNCEKGLLSFSLLFGEGVAPRPGPLGMEMPPKISSHPGRTDGNSQPFRELRSITRQHRGCGGDWVC